VLALSYIQTGACPCVATDRPEVHSYTVWPERDTFSIGVKISDHLNSIPKCMGTSVC
jgi:hypothetical protein